MNSSKLLIAMLERDYTREKLAKKLDISEGTLSKKLNGISEFKQSEINAITKALKLKNSEVMHIFFD